LKIAIVIPLKAKKVADNWQIVEERLFNTLVSIAKQTNSRYCTCVIGHDCPSYFSDTTGILEHIDFVKFDELDPPELCEDASKNQEKFEKDRCAKIFSGYQYLLQNQPDITHLFPLDADDLLHEDFIKTLIELSMPNYIIENGYFYYLSSNLVNKTSSFSTYCGSSAILSCQLLEDEIKKSRHFLFKHIGHVYMRTYLHDTGIPFHIPQKKLVMYVRDNGENISRLVRRSVFLKLKINIKKWIKSLTVFTPSVLKKFGVKE